MAGYFFRFVPALFALFVVAIAAPGTAAAQSAPVRAVDAQAFLGEWAVEIDAQGQAVVFELDIIDENGNVVAEVNDPMNGGAIRIDRVSKSGDNLVLSYNLDAQGQQFPISVTLAPAADALDARIDVASGMFTSAAKATRR